MECNKDEAVRAKEIAEKKFIERNYSVARKFAMKAQNLYPELEGLSQMMTTLDVYISAENKVNGESDWYGILGVSHSADDDTIRKQYRKLALILHPDKNKSLGAEGAFKLVSEAWSFLSDKAKRLAYNQKRDFRGGRPKVPTRHSVPPSANGFQKFTSNVSLNPRTSQQSNFCTGASQKKADTFWTICNRCKTHYEYLRVYLNHTLLCPNCNDAFLALEKSPPPNVFKSSNSSSRQQHQNIRQNAASSNSYNPGRNSGVSQNSEPRGSVKINSFNNTNFQWRPFSKTDGIASSVSLASVAAQAASVVQQAGDKVKRDREEAQSAEWERNQTFSLKRNYTEHSQMYSHLSHMANQMSRGGVPESMHGFYGPFSRSISQRELSVLETRNMLIGKAQAEIRKKLKEWRSLADRKSLKKVNKRQKNAVNGVAHDTVVGSEVASRGNRNKNSFLSSPTNDTVKESEPMSINVPDSDFHNFDLDRTESSFGDDQVWAAYDVDDGMPRYYARIHKVISLKPFKMRISWLNSRSNSELGPLDWVGAGFAKTCGDFRTGKHEITESLNSFSHKVSWTKGLRGVIQIYPRKGEVWALYRNWSYNWNENTPDEIVHKYDMVEVLDDFNEERGVSVSPLIKVAGFRTVFHKHTDPKEVGRIIPKEEMFRFSHQVPYYLLTGQEADNAPKGCRELDPAATPLELLQIITEAEADKAPNGENNGNNKEEFYQCALDENSSEVLRSGDC